MSSAVRFRVLYLIMAGVSTMYWPCLAQPRFGSIAGRIVLANTSPRANITPSEVVLVASQTQQFSTSVNTGKTTVNWTLSPQFGMISSTGLYTAPPDVSSQQVITVTATSSADPTRTATATVIINPPVTVSVTPSRISLTASQSQQFSAAVTGTSNTAVRWTVSPNVGTVTDTGLYTAPADLTAQQTVTVTATSRDDRSKSGSAVLTLMPPVSLSVTPGTVKLKASQSQQFTASVTGTSNSSVVWSLSPNVGVVSSAGVYTAPASVFSQQSVLVTATSLADSNKKASAALTLNPTVAVSVAPGVVRLAASQSQQFTASVSGASDSRVTWTLSPNVGTLSSSGSYAAPASVLSPQTVTVTATSVADSTAAASAALTIAPTVAVSVTPGMANLPASQNQQFTASVTGSSNTAVTWTLNPNVGTISSAGLYSAPASISGQQTVSVIATSSADPTKTASATMTLNPTVSVSVSPVIANLTASQTQQFAASVTGASNVAVTWTLSPNVGTVSPSGLYTPPAFISSQQTVTLTATSSADQTKAASAVLTLNPMVSVSMSPGTTTLTTSQFQQFTASVAGSSNTAVTWALTPNVGTISSAGLYTAPASISGQQTVTVTATSAADPTKTASATLTLNPAVAVSMNPASASLTASQAQQFAVSITGSNNTAVTWALSPNVGTISSSGLYTAPATISAAQTLTVTAASAADPTKTASAMVTLNPTVSVSVSPGTASLSASQTQLITAAVTGTANTGVTWSLSPQVGTLSISGSTVVYTAPGSVTQNQTISVMATSMADSSKIAAASILLLQTVAVALSPASIDLTANQAQQFSASVTGAANTDVTWSATPAVGTISSAGLYTAPSTITTDQDVLIAAVSAADQTKSATVKVSLKAAGGISFTTRANGLDTVIFNGVDYNYKYGEGLLTNMSWSNSTGLETGKCSASFDASSVTWSNCNSSQTNNPFHFKVAYSTRGSDTVCAQISLSNDSPANTLSSAMFSPIGFYTPNANAVNVADSSLGSVGRGNVLDHLNYGSGRWAFWVDTPSNNMSFNVACGWSFVCKSQPVITSVPPASSISRTVCEKFTTDTTLSSYAFVPEAYSAYTAAFPPVINWPDRRPINAWFLSDGGHRSALNRRGWFNDPLFDISNIPAFKTRALAIADSIIGAMNARPVRPQGIILWDIEGQEFDHSTTYIGDPRVFASGYAPEMDATADDLFAKFRDAGYRVGVTLRPQYLQWGTLANRPTTCTTDVSNDYKDYYICVDCAYGEAFNACYTTDTWSSGGGLAAGNGGQTFYSGASRDTAVTALLRSKIRYAKTRWGVTLFYVDTTVWPGGAPISADIFRTLQTEFPDCLFIPEQETMDTLSAGIPFTDPKNSSDPRFSPVTWRWAYPTGAMAVKLSDCTDTCWTNNLWSFQVGQKVGDIALYNQPGQISSSQMQAIETMIQQAQFAQSKISVTDSATGRQRSFSGNPNGVLAYPLKMRVYFAASAVSLANSSLYCEAGQLLGENSCTLDLTGMMVSETRYYDFTNKFVSREPFAPLQ